MTLDAISRAVRLTQKKLHVPVRSKIPRRRALRPVQRAANGNPTSIAMVMIGMRSRYVYVKQTAILAELVFIMVERAACLNFGMAMDLPLA